MDIVLERILSLIPKKENGDFVHGEKKKFAEQIGLKSGNVISDWIMGRSSSYPNYIYKISAVYGVSVEWLKGETDEKSPPPVGDGLSGTRKELIDKILTLSDDDLKKLSDIIDLISKGWEK